MAQRKGKKEDLLDFEIAFYEGVLKRTPRYIEAIIPLAEAYTRKGFYEKGLEMDLRLTELCADDPVAYYNLACSYALLGKKQEALTTLQKAVALGYSDFAHLRKDADLKSLYGDPEFEKIKLLDK
jgi:tetratricopeptide (TPR) repeat protein